MKQFLTLLLTAWILAIPAGHAADHLDSPGVRNDPAADINDVFAFVNPNDPDELILVATVSPVAGAETRFSNAVEYQFVIANAAIGEQRISCSFNGNGRFLCRGPRTAVSGTVGDVATGPGMRVFAGLADDPFYFDLVAFQETVATLQPQFTNPGSDFFKGLDTLAIAVGIQRTRVTGAGAPVVSVYANTLRAQASACRPAREFGQAKTRLNRNEARGDQRSAATPGCALAREIQVDRMGRPAVNTALINLLGTSPGLKDEYNAERDPAQWAPRFQAEIEANLAALDTLDGTSGNALLPAAALAGVLVDDRLLIDTSVPDCDAYLAVELGVAGQCGGRTLARDVIDDTLGAVVGPGVSDNASNTSTFRSHFPFIGAPNAPSASN